MKQRLAAVLEYLQRLEDNLQIRDPGMMDFKQAKNELIDIMANVDAAPEPAAVPAAPAVDPLHPLDPSDRELTNGLLTNLLLRIGQIETAVVDLVKKSEPAAPAV